MHSHAYAAARPRLSNPLRGPGWHRAQVTAGARAVRMRPFQVAPLRSIYAVGIRLWRQVQRLESGPQLPAVNVGLAPLPAAGQGA